MKSLLLLRQALASREPLLRPESRSKLRLSGGLVELGNFRSFVSHNDVSRELRLGVTINSAMDANGLHRESQQLTLMAGVEPGGDVKAIEYDLSADFYFGLNSQSDQQSLLPEEDSALKDSQVEGQAILKRATFKIQHREENLLEFQLTSTSGATQPWNGYSLVLPFSYVERLPELESMEFEQISGDNVVVRTTLRGILPERLIAKSRADDSASPRYWPLPSHLEEVLQDLRSDLVRLTYLGPLRAPAQRYYTGQGDSNSEDPTGESLPYILRDRLQDNVFTASPQTHRPERTQLALALNSWLYYLRTGTTSESVDACKNELHVSSVQDVLVGLGIKSPNGAESHALTDSGFGYSQVLPILVKGLMLSRGSTLLIEQPELHLNPALQVRLADFFVAMATVNKQILIETHSEHIVNAIRAESVEAYLRDAFQVDLSEGLVRNRYTILFLENEGKGPQLHRLNILQDGTVPDWPASFFGESSQLLGRILRAQRKAKGKA
jgi:hypothetical protein